eukprot:7852702-Ditylum_brightwellii.AAC.2
MKKRAVGKPKMNKVQSSASAVTPAGITKENYCSRSGNLAHGSLTTRDQQYVAVFPPAFELQAPGRQALRDCPLTHPSGLEVHDDVC